MGGNLSQPTSSSHDDDEQYYDDPAEPTRIVRAMLFHLGLPTELVLDIMDLADYHPRIGDGNGPLDPPFALPANKFDPSDYCSACAILQSPPIPGSREDENWRMLRVAWTIEGRDQGWGGDHPGTFDGAWSWYEACILRPTGHSLDEASRLDAALDLHEWLHEHPLHRTTEDVQKALRDDRVGWELVPNSSGCVTWRVQNNRWLPGKTLDPGVVDAEGHGGGGGFVDALRPGDVVVLWMRAMFPGWANHLKEADVEIVYDVR
ncbi:uncharacterized protein BXZ73DRAFT_92559 [Epithele typhae]|uniref:uncharacterized protein n=1 Tax=Epithele typhae TaxID=378194 RepID=UPI0020080743|nr:uncharacterized protein BXZ73DRAFT_92559 [Epithele typhae]KAH9915770.1 hypothetical protein BXZ73DRAFT_92559 [Epithele typhae]